MAILGFPSYMIGQRISNVTVTGGSFTNNGTFVAGTTPATGNLSTTGVFDGFTLRRVRDTTRIRPINALIDNNVGLAAGFEASIMEIRRSDGSSLLDAMASAYAYLQCIVHITDIGASTPTTTQGIVGLIVDASNEDVEDKNIITVSLIPCGVATYSGIYSPTPNG